MSTDTPPPGSANRGAPRSGGRRVDRAGERSYLSLVPRRNLIRALFLLLALMAVIAIKKSGGGFFRGVLDTVAPSSSASSTPGSAPDTRRGAPETTVHLQSGPRAR